MVRILVQGISCLTLLLHFSCRSNHTDRGESFSAADSEISKKAIVPIPVNATELCAHFNSSTGNAAAKYKDHILVLSGIVAQSAPEPIDNDCRNIIMNCENTDSRDTSTLSIVIRQCKRGERADDTISPGKIINIHCRFTAYKDGVIQMEEVAAPE